MRWLTQFVGRRSRVRVRSAPPDRYPLAGTACILQSSALQDSAENPHFQGLAGLAARTAQYPR